MHEPSENVSFRFLCIAIALRVLVAGIHLVYHKVAEKVAHKATHQVEHRTKRSFKALTDVIVWMALILLDWFSSLFEH